MFRDSTELAATYMVPSSGGPARKVLEDIVAFDTGVDSTVVVRAPRERHHLEFVNLQNREVIRTITLPDSVGEVGDLAWSSDRRLIAFEATGTVWTLPGDGGPVNRIGAGWSVRWASGSSALYYLTGPWGAVELHRAPIDRRTGAKQGDAIRVVPLPRAYDLSLGRGDRLIYSQSTSSVQARAFVFSGGVPRRVVDDRLLTEGTAEVSGVAISADGQSVAYSQGRGGNEDVYAIPFGGGSARPVASSPAGEAQPSWAPDGSRLAFARKDSSRRVLMVMDVNGGIPQRVGSLPGPGRWSGLGGRGQWSADGKHLAYYSLDLRRAVLIDLERQTESVLAVPDSAGTGYHDLVPSPNGSTVIASTLVRATDWGELWLAQREGGRWRRLRGPFGESSPLLWRDDGWIYLYNLRALATDAGWYRSELWRMHGPDGRPELYARLPDGCVQTDLSADASRAVCVSLRTESDLYLVTNFSAGRN